MKQAVFTVILSLTSIIGYAQKISEPEYIGQVAIVNQDSTTSLLQKETTELKAKSSGIGFLPVPGAGLLDKTKSFVAVKGTAAPTKVQDKHLTLLIRVKDNNEAPKDVIGIIKFEVKKKERRYQMASIGTLSGSKITTTFSTVPHNVKKYGTSSYLVSMENLEQGEYGVVIGGDLSNIASFSVK